MSFSNEFKAIVKNETLDIACKEVAALIDQFLVRS